MSAAKLTPWFPAEAKPARPGVYEKDFMDYPGDFSRREFQYWDGARWHYGHGTPEETAADARTLGIEPTPRRWRGLAADPSTSVPKGNVRG
jgi:hypothetical protein